MSAAGKVYIIGAGPGDPGLITARGVKLLADADVVVYDRDVEGHLRWARPEAERIAAGEPAERETAQDAISMLLAEKARDGHTVARLKWGDAFVFDSGAKEALFLHEQGVAFEVVPGIPAAIGSTAYAGIPVTYPGAGDALVLIRGHEGGTDALPDVDWHAIAQLDGTIVCYLGGRAVGKVLQSLVDAGATMDQTVALIYHGTQATQRTIVGTIEDVLEKAATIGDGEPVVLVVGEVACLRDHLRWFDERPLFGRRIIITQSQEQAREMTEGLENLGAQVIEAPTFRLAPPDDPEAVDRAAASVDDYDWVIFESAGAVGRLMSAIARGPRDLRALGRTSLCAIGPTTANRLAGSALKADVIVPELRVESVVDAMLAHGPVSGRRVLIVRPDHLRDVLAQELTSRGATVTDLVAYRTAPASPDSPAVQDIYRRLLDGKVDAVTFASPMAVQRFAALVGEEQVADLLSGTVVAAIGPVTEAAASALGIETTVLAETFTIEGLIGALVAKFSS
jgi:uroporphyrinogen III methyltransferase/synthase